MLIHWLPGILGILNWCHHSSTNLIIFLLELELSRTHFTMQSCSCLSQPIQVVYNHFSFHAAFKQLFPIIGHESLVSVVNCPWRVKVVHSASSDWLEGYLSPVSSACHSALDHTHWSWPSTDHSFYRSMNRQEATDTSCWQTILHVEKTWLCRKSWLSCF